MRWDAVSEDPIQLLPRMFPAEEVQQVPPVAEVQQVRLYEVPVLLDQEYET